jgi:hypothetical protein
MTESELHIQVCNYVRFRNPKIRFSSNYGSGMKLTIRQASIQRLQQSNAGYPDLFIIYNNGKYSGLFIELKKDGTKIYKKDGVTFKSDHLERQNDYIQYLNEQGFYACFCIGYDDAIKTIDEYIGVDTLKVEF